MQYPDIKQYDTFPKVLAWNAEHYPDDVAMREKEFGIWQEFTWQDYNNHVKWLALGLKELGIKEQEVIALLGDNRPEWVWGEVAAHSLRCYSMGIYQDSLHEETEYLLNFSEASVVIAEDEEQCDKLLELEDQIPSVKLIVYCDPRGMRKYKDQRLVDVRKVYELGKAIDKRSPETYLKMIAATKGDDLSILCTTSGTTSKPKLAKHHSGPFLDHCAAYLRADPKQAGDNYVSVLPLPWIMEQVYAVGQALLHRQVVNFVETQETLMSDLREIGPNFVLLAPRVWENLAAEIHSRMMDSQPLKQKLFNLGMKLAESAMEKGKKSALAELILMKALRDRLGFSNLTSAATGGAAMGPDTFKLFNLMGVPLKQLYGQTEMAGAYTIHQNNDMDYESVGVPFDNSELRIGNPDENGVGEIVARTTGMFTGYHKNQQAYDEDVRDGWMHTGDAGYIKKDNRHLVVIDRIKDLAETSNGVRFSPQYIENKLKFSPYVAEAVVLGKDKPNLTAIICIRFSIVSKWAESQGISFTNYTNLSARPEVRDLIRKAIDEVNESLPESQRVQRFMLLYKELDADDGELTRTRKVRRGVIAEKYADIIDALYDNSDSVDIDTMITFQDGSQSRIQTTLEVVKLHLDTPIMDKTEAQRRLAS
ncbi:long-chain fatty acid--CoA ligase [Sansalvadorimonas sp. 2012CJ34-2]|uniref:Long-chain fatty acid--CoA ligase n=1 Tax=Parendozoicomonas callyspongiae TaxID=2942213 RepID=A0ABT0PD24_9GAMM|nr:long-chain fatty acid--CoA ligase [Sansalvadorimonas sp. 2012CJ34-2]MCL6269265.1 long-chain fatty acid--CoA ligase [Sansalvadorimonas sp. 2012CJ34-2]